MNSINNKVIAASLGSILTMATFANAQEAVQTPAKEEAPQSWYERDSLFLASATESVSEKTGFTPALTWTGEVWGDVSNKNNMNSFVDSLFTIEVEQDLSVLSGKDNMGKIGVSAFYYNQTHGGALENVDSSQGYISNIVAGDMARVFEIYYANEFETKAGTFGFRIGQLAADEDFMGMDYSDTFLNSSFGAMPNIAPGNLFSQYNVATLGLVVYYTYDNFDATFGVYNGNIGEDISSNNGFDYKNTFDTVAFWYQFGYNYKVGGLDGRVMVGGNYHSDPSKANFEQGTKSNFYSFYAGIQQALVNDDEGNAKFGVYGRVGFVPDAEQSDNNFYADFGFNWFAPIPCRENDVFAAGFSVIENERTARDDYAHYEGTLEVTYRCQITPAISFQPDFQIYFNPATRDDCGAVYVAGARLEVVF